MKTVSAVALVFVAVFGVVPVTAQPANDPLAVDGDEDVIEEAAADAIAAEALAEAEAPKAQYGLQLRLRYILVPKGMIELFMAEAASGVSSPGFGLDFVRRRDNFEFSVGFEYENISPKNGYYIENGGSTSNLGTVDYTEFKNFSWLTLDANFVFHTPIAQQFALRYGGGFGLGWIRGEIRQTDAVCTGTNTQSECTHPSDAPDAQINEKANIPPVFPVINLLAGVQFTPLENLRINLDIGVRTLPFVGTSVQYFF